MTFLGTGLVGESKKIIDHDEGKFDPRSMPIKSWNDCFRNLLVYIYDNLRYLFRKTSYGTNRVIIILGHRYRR